MGRPLTRGTGPRPDARLLLPVRLSPLERAVFALRQVFGFGFRDFAAAVGREP